MTTHSQRALILYRRRRFINHLLTYLLMCRQIIVRSQKQPGRLWRVECASGASISYQDLGCRRIETTHQERVHGHIWITLLLSGASVCALAFTLEAEDISSTWCKDLLHVWRFLRDNRPNCRSCLSLFNDWIKMYIDGSLWHFEFPKVVLAHI